MGKKTKAQSSKAKDSCLEHISVEDRGEEEVSQQNVSVSASGDIIAGFDFLKSLVGDDGMGDSVVAACLRKMSKKDSTTKIKALHEFIDLASNPNTDIVPFLQFWSRCYCRLTMCGDHRVRELSQIALGAVIKKAGRHFAPCLKVTLPYCIFSHADSVATVASAAKACLQTSFNDSRRVQAISMCTGPTLELISSIIKNTNPYLADKSLCLDEEEALRSDRLISSCLGAWSVLLVNQFLLSSTAASAAPNDSLLDKLSDEILACPEFSKYVLKSDSYLVIAALHFWVITLSTYNRQFIENNETLFLSTLFLNPVNAAEVNLRGIDVGSWQGAAALYKALPQSFWKHRNVDKKFFKSLFSLMNNGPSNFVAPPSVFSSMSEIQEAGTIAEASVALSNSYMMSDATDECVIKFSGQFIDNSLQGLAKIKSFHVKNQQLDDFSEAVFGGLSLFLDTAVSNNRGGASSLFCKELFAICWSGFSKAFWKVLAMEPSVSSLIMPYIVKFYIKILSNDSTTQPAFFDSLKSHIQQNMTIGKVEVDSVNLATFFSLLYNNDVFDKNEALMALLVDTVCVCLRAMKEVKMSLDILNFVSLLSTDVLVRCCIVETMREKCKLAVASLAEEVLKDLDTGEGQTDISFLLVSKVLLPWDFLLSEPQASLLLKALVNSAATAEEFALVLDKLPNDKLRSDENVIAYCNQMLTCSAMLKSPEKVSYSLTLILKASQNCEGSSRAELVRFSVQLLEDVAKVTRDTQSPYYIARFIPTDQGDTEPIYVFSAWLNKGEDVRHDLPSLPLLVSCLVDIFESVSEAFANEIILSSYAVDAFLAICLVSKCYSKPFKSDVLKLPVFLHYSNALTTPSFFELVRDILLFSKDTFTFLAVCMAELFEKAAQTTIVDTVFPSDEIAVDLQSIESLAKCLNSWLLSSCLEIRDQVNMTAKHSLDISAELYLKKLTFGVLSLVTWKDKTKEPLSKTACRFVVEAASVSELLTTSFKHGLPQSLCDQLLDVTDYFLLFDEDDRAVVLKQVIAFCRSDTSLLSIIQAKLFFTYLLDGRHVSTKTKRILSCIEDSLNDKFDANSNADNWLLGSASCRVLLSEDKPRPHLLSLLIDRIKTLLTTSPGNSKCLSSWSYFAAVLGSNFCDAVKFEENDVRTLLASLLSPSMEVFPENCDCSALIDGDNEPLLCSQLNATADLSLIFNCCLRYTPKLDSIDNILCKLCSWISTVCSMANHLVVRQSENVSFELKVSLARCLLASVQCCQTVHLVLSTSNQFHFAASATQLSEFAEFYQLQYLDGLIQLLMALWLPSSGDGHRSFFSSVLGNLPLQDKITFSIVSCLQKASSLDVIAHVHLAPLYCADESYLPEDVQTIIGRLSPLITNPAVEDVRVHLAIYTVLATLNSCLAGIYLSLSASISSQQDDDDSFVLTPPRVWVRDVSLLTDPVSIAIASDFWRVHPGPVSSYLFSWLLIIRLAGSLPSEVRPPMVNFLRKSPEFRSLLLNVFALAPLIPESVDPAPFDSLPQLTNSSDAIPLIGHLSCYMIRELLVHFPVVVRSWLNNQSVALRRDIVRYVSTNLSPALRAVELSKVRQAEFDESITVRASTATGELFASYKTEAVRLDLAILLPDDYPLSPPTIESKQNILNKAGKLWLRQLTALCICQNGTILDALLLWQKLVTEKLGKLEECTICYSIVQGGNLNLPKRQCKTCKKLFHSACLFKWFESSGNVTCPLCREQFY